MSRARTRQRARRDQKTRAKQRAGQQRKGQAVGTIVATPAPVHAPEQPHVDWQPWLSRAKVGARFLHHCCRVTRLDNLWNIAWSLIHLVGMIFLKQMALYGVVWCEGLPLPNGYHMQMSSQTLSQINRLTDILIMGWLFIEVATQLRRQFWREWHH